jgi:hypothetical protein
MSHDQVLRSTVAMALDRGAQGEYEAYNEAAFRHFLALERKRADRSSRSLLLLLVELSGERPGRASISQAAGESLLTALAACVREVDFIGWYRAGRTIGAVLTQGPDEPASDVSMLIADRVSEAVKGRVPDELADRVHVRILQLRSSSRN